MSFPRYAEYKDSGVEWLGEVPGHWEVRRLRFLAEMNPSKTEVAGLCRSMEVSFLPMEAVGDDGSLDLERTRPIQEVESGYTYFREGDVAFAKITPCFENGKGAIMQGLVSGVGFGTTELIVARPKPDHATAAYLHWLFSSIPFRKLGEAAMYGAGGQKRVPDAFVRDFALGAPPLTEQSAIAAFLDRETGKIDALVAEQEKLIALLKEKRQAVVDDAVNCREGSATKLAYHVDLLSGFAFPSAGFTHDDGNTRLLRGANVGVGTLRWDDTVYWSSEDVEPYRRYALEEGDLVFGMDRPWIGRGVRVAEVTENDLPCLLLQRVARLRPRSDLEKGFLKLVLMSRAFFGHFEPELTGVSVPHISPEQILSYRLRLPPLQMQQERVEEALRQLQAMEAVEETAQSAIDLLKERRSALISAAVTGKIDVRGLVAVAETEAA